MQSPSMRPSPEPTSDHVQSSAATTVEKQTRLSTSDHTSYQQKPPQQQQQQQIKTNAVDTRRLTGKSSL